MADEQQTNAQAETKTTAANIDDGNKPQGLNAIDRANNAAERLEKANTETSRIIKEQEELLAEMKLGGISGSAKQVEKPKEIDPREYAKAALKGIILKN